MRTSRRTTIPRSCRGCRRRRAGLRSRASIQAVKARATWRAPSQAAFGRPMISSYSLRMGDLHHPVLPGSAASDYERYLRTDELLSLQKTPDEQLHRDELLFQTIHQSSELWLKL